MCCDITEDYVLHLVFIAFNLLITFNLHVLFSSSSKYFSMNWNRHGASLWKGMKWLLYTEIVAIGAGYYVWHKMNVSEGKYIHSDSKQSSNNEYVYSYNL